VTTKLLLIDCKTMHVARYDGRKRDEQMARITDPRLIDGYALDQLNKFRVRGAKGLDTAVSVDQTIDQPTDLINMTNPEANPPTGLTDAECRDRLRQILDLVRDHLPLRNIPAEPLLGAIIRLLGPQPAGLDAAVKPITNQETDDLDDMLVGRHLSPRAAGETLRQAIDRIINWEVMVNTDPAVSSTARELIEKGRYGGLLQLIQHLNQNPYSLTKSECIEVAQGMRGSRSRAHLAQDLDRGLFDALSRDPNARQLARESLVFKAEQADLVAKVPLTEQQILDDDGIMGCNKMMMLDLVAMVRAIERAHGIGAQS
jgi:hypothetical protein